MDREQLMNDLTRAFSPNEMATAIAEAREYLRDHPDDERIWAELEALMDAERGYVVG